MERQQCSDLDTSEEPVLSPLEMSAHLQHVIARVQGTADWSAPADGLEDLTDRILKSQTAIAMELAELIDRLPWKYWKSYPYDFEISDEELVEMQMEAIDVYFFLNNIFLAFGLDTKQVERLYGAKYQENLRRQEEEYAPGAEA